MIRKPPAEISHESTQTQHHKGGSVRPALPRLATQFLSEARRLAAAGVTGTIQHIGSTAVPGLAAKPVIDIQLVIADEQWDPRPLTAAGYRWIRGFTRSSRYYERPAEGTTYLIRVRDPSDPNVRRYLLFRDYLIAHPTEAAAYRALKSDLARRYPRRPARYRAGRPRGLSPPMTALSNAPQPPAGHEHQREPIATTADRCRPRRARRPHRRVGAREDGGRGSSSSG